jgi:uncharacterized protein HemY
MKITLRIPDRCTPETAKHLIQLASSLKTDIHLDLSVDQTVARGLMEAAHTWQTEAVPNGLIPRLCKVLKAVEGDNEAERLSAISDLKTILGIN